MIKSAFRLEKYSESHRIERTDLAPLGSKLRPHSRDDLPDLASGLERRMRECLDDVFLADVPDGYAFNPQLVEYHLRQRSTSDLLVKRNGFNCCGFKMKLANE
jgi:hypothetical protein